MIKLLAMSVFGVTGAITGAVFCRVANTGISQPMCIGLGVLGAFGGILLADLADLRLIGNLADGLLFASAGSILLLCLNWLRKK